MCKISQTKHSKSVRCNSFYVSPTETKHHLRIFVKNFVVPNAASFVQPSVSKMKSRAVELITQKGNVAAGDQSRLKYDITPDFSAFKLSVEN